MKTHLAVMIALTVSLGELTTSAAVLPAGAAFGGSLSLENTGNTDLLKLGYPASVNATSATAFTGLSGSDDAQDSVTVAIGNNNFYHFRLVYNQSASDLDFYIWGGDSTESDAANVATHLNADAQGAVEENDLYSALVASGKAGFAQNMGNLTGLAFGFYAPANYQIQLTSLGLTGASWSSGIASTNLTFSGGSGAAGVSDFLNGYVINATGLSDGFTLDGVFRAIYTGSTGSADQATKLGFEVYAVVPEPATVAFGLALVGGLGLMEVRRRKKS